MLHEIGQLRLSFGCAPAELGRPTRLPAAELFIRGCAASVTRRRMASQLARPGVGAGVARERALQLLSVIGLPLVVPPTPPTAMLRASCARAWGRVRGAHSHGACIGIRMHVKQ